MTQPSLTTTFDTSLIPVTSSFSSTETNTSGSSGKENKPPTTAASPSLSAQHVSTTALYSQWASRYDVDGNILQAVDDLEMQHLIPKFAAEVNRSAASDNTSRVLRVLDLGCGTGRNTTKLLLAPWAQPVEIQGWDASVEMLAIARQKCRDQGEGHEGVDSEFAVVDFCNDENIDWGLARESFGGVLSTLVLEHVLLDVFFARLARLLRPGAVALVSNMHSDMGGTTQAGFKNGDGQRVKGESYVYTTQQTVEATKAAGLEVMGEVLESAVRSEMIDGGRLDGKLIQKGWVREGARKWVGVKVWYAVLLRKPIHA